MTRGQCMDLAFESRLDIGIDDYLAMISCKTGALIRCGMEIGALVASDDQKVITTFARCGASLGRAFQIRDDVLGIWADQGTTGKAVGNDIRRKKKSFPIVYALGVAGRAARGLLEEAYGKSSLDDPDVDGVLDALEELDVERHAQEVIREQGTLALEQARRLPLSPRAMAEMEELVEFLVERSS